MDKFLNLLIEGITSGNIFVVAIIVAMAIIFNFEKIFTFLHTRKKVKIQLIEESLNNPHVNGDTKLYLESLIEQEYFKAITGIGLEKEIREALIQAHKEANGELKFKHFKRAIPFLLYKDDILSIKIDKFSVFGFIYNFVFGVLLIIVGFALFILPAFLSDITIQNILSSYGAAMFMIFSGGLMFLESLPIISARNVQKLLTDIHSKAMQQEGNSSDE
jgi:hypothetical protein